MNYKTEYQRWLDNARSELQTELRTMDATAIEDAFFRDLSFGTGGLRGKIGAGTNRMNVHVVGKASQGLSNYLLTTTAAPSVVIGYDSRNKSDMFAKTAAAVFAENGIRVYIWPELSPVPTVSFAVRKMNASAGVMITASHNPSNYNGYKVYGPDGCQITTETAKAIQIQINSLDIFSDIKICNYEEGLKDKRIDYIGSSVMDDFIEAVKGQSVLFGDEIDRNVSIVYSPLNGTGLKPVTRALVESGFTNITLVEEQKTPDGNFPTCPYPNPEVREAMELGLKYCKKMGAELLLATDPDADRCGIAVSDGDDYRLLSGNEVGLLLLDYICSQRAKHGRMPENPVFIKTIVTMDLAEKIADHYGVQTINVLTGFKFIGEVIGRLEEKGRVSDYICGFEESYGYLTGTYVRDKDAVNAAFMICEMFAFYKFRGISLIDRLNELYTSYGYCLNTLHSYEFDGSYGMAKMQEIMEDFRKEVNQIGGIKVLRIEDYSNGLKGLPKSDVLKFFMSTGSVTIRPSGTEPKLKAYISVMAEDCDKAEKIEKHLNAALAGQNEIEGKLMNIILLSGGSGKRLWPLSNDVRSKQFLKIFRRADGTKESMAMRMYRMIKEVDPDSTITIATSENQIPQIKSQLGENVGISVEPTRRDTFPAIALAAAYLKKQGVGADEAIVVCPVDPYVESNYFECLKEISDAVGEANLTLMGIEPTYPSEKFGYIIPINKAHISPVSEFKEKPTAEVAEKYIEQGALWNGGVFAFKLSYVLNISYMLFGTDSYDELFAKYGELQKISFDYAVVEKEKSINVIRFSGSWKDLGTWNTLTEAMDEPVTGNAVAEECENTHVVNELSIPVIALGIKNAVIAATPDGILVSEKEKSPKLKAFVADARPMYERRGWGEYKVLDYKLHQDQNNSLVKELILTPGKHISYQRHKHRTEIWTFTEGIGTLIVDDEIKEVRRGDVAVIKPGVKHAIEAVSELHIIEVQIGDELTEEDIERLDWDWK